MLSKIQIEHSDMGGGLGKDYPGAFVPAFYFYFFLSFTFADLWLLLYIAFYSPLNLLFIVIISRYNNKVSPAPVFHTSLVRMFHSSLYQLRKQQSPNEGYFSYMHTDAVGAFVQNPVIL